MSLAMIRHRWASFLGTFSALLLGVAVLSVCLSLWAAAQPQPTGAATIDYQRQVHTILAAQCLGCHSAERRSGGLSLASYADVLEGGDQEHLVE